MINQTNCKNCGAILHYDTANRIAKCSYCETEYHLDNLGRIEEYKVELEIMGQRRMFYIETITVRPTYYDFGRNLDGTLISVKTGDNIEISLISY